MCNIDCVDFRTTDQLLAMLSFIAKINKHAHFQRAEQRDAETNCNLVKSPTTMGFVTRC